jgi:hypothetical protein
MKLQEDGSGSREYPPSILSHSPFLSSSVKTLTIKTAKDQLVISGLILPSHQLTIHRVVKDVMAKRGQSEYTTQYSTEKHTRSLTKTLSDGLTGCPINETAINLGSWLATTPQNIRDLRWKDGYYLY